MTTFFLYYIMIQIINYDIDIEWWSRWHDIGNVSSWWALNPSIITSLYTVDQTPPSLTFVSKPSQVNDNETFSMTWTVSESLSMERCNLTTPTNSSVVNCRGSFNQIFVVPGNYSISIELEDLNGNKAGPFKHKWIVSMYLSAFVCISYV